MATAIIYASKHGCTCKVSGMIQEKLTDVIVDLHPLNRSTVISLPDYDNIIIGGSIYAGQISKNLKDFIVKNIEFLLRHPLGLFICCMQVCQSEI